MHTESNENLNTPEHSQPLNVPCKSWESLWKTNTKKTFESHGTLYHEPFEALFRIQRGLAGYVSFLAACNANIVFTEYLLYEPILRILRQMDYAVDCEVPSVGNAAGLKGDPKRIDFVAEKDGRKIALEIKWLRWKDDERDYLDVARDVSGHPKPAR